MEFVYLEEIKTELKELNEKLIQLQKEISILNNNYRFDIKRAFEEIDKINGIGVENDGEGV